MYSVHACGVRVVILEHGALAICKSSLCTENRGPLRPLHSRFVLFFLVSERVAGGGSRPRSEAPCIALQQYRGLPLYQYRGCFFLWLNDLFKRRGVY